MTRSGVEVGGVDPARPQLAGELEALVEEVLARRREVVDERRHVVEALVAAAYMLAVDRRRVVVLLDELDHHVAEVAEARRTRRPPAPYPGTRSAAPGGGHGWRTDRHRAARLHARRRRLQVVDDVRLLEQREGRHRLSTVHAEMPGAP